METETAPTHMPLNWFAIWLDVLLRPTVKTFSRISNDPKASSKRGIVWMAIASVITWFAGPQRATLSGFVADMFGLESFSRFLLIGALVAPVLGVTFLLINAAIAHGLARIFKGEGTFHQLVYCWAVMQLPFVLVLGLIGFFPTVFPSTREFAFSTAGMILTLLSLLATIGVVLYWLFAEMVAFSAVEKLGILKALGILLLQSVFVACVGVFLLSVFQSVMMNSFRH